MSELIEALRSHLKEIHATDSGGSYRATLIEKTIGELEAAQSQIQALQEQRAKEVEDAFKEGWEACFDARPYMTVGLDWNASEAKRRLAE